MRNGIHINLHLNNDDPVTAEQTTFGSFGVVQIKTHGYTAVCLYVTPDTVAQARAIAAAILQQANDLEAAQRAAA